MGLDAMQLNTGSYGAGVRAILESVSDPMNLLVASAAPSAELRKSILADLFKESAHPLGALSGLWLYFDCFEESHKVAQEDDSPEGSLWHAIAHRREPDYSNAGYWFRQVGAHPVYPAILEAARLVPGKELRLGSTWDPLAFVEFCQEAERAGGALAAHALALQRAEWQAVFDYCARKRLV
jgi:hypothetical protein